MSYFTLWLMFAEEVEGGLFDFNATLPLMALQFLLLMVLLNSIFYKPITKVLDERDEYIRQSLTEASNNIKETEELTRKYKLELSKARKEALELINSSKKEAQEIVDKKIKEAQKETESLVSEAFAQLKTEQTQALNILENQISTLSEQIKQKLLSKQSVF
uniref:ATP synthase CFO B' subunit subunit II n=1 Tax=Rhodaphanes brevistipitata TaxID=446136 RepID=UPI001FCE1C7F|nr:ATP synthase CFO B' subunit subunit II [Rhodaphanes brevistipitata]UNJ18520.1 ATP synthase CFO B' subunit subunit II [Rhodaphanes brevistipitata]